MAAEATKNNDKPKKKRSLGRWFKEVFSELKKVTWPTFGKVVKQTGTVLVVTLFFMLVLLAMDQLLGLAYKGLTSGLPDSGGGATEALNTLMSGVKAITGIGNTAAGLPLLI